MAPIKFNGLPLDIKIIIISYIIRPTDMKNVCLVSNELRMLMTPRPYRKVVLTIGATPDHRMIAMLRIDNPGLPYIRTLELCDDPSFDEEQAHFAVRLLLDTLPRDTLTESFLRWECSILLTVDNILLLYRQQSRLLRLETSDTDQPLLGILRQAPEILAHLKSVKRISVQIHNEDALCLGSEFLRVFPKIDSLEINSYLDYDDEFFDVRFEGIHLEPVARVLFQHMLPYVNCSPLLLQRLKLTGLDLENVVTTLTRVIDLSVLESLTIEGSHMRNFLEGLTEAYSQLNGKGRLAVLGIPWTGDEAEPYVAALDNFFVAIPKMLIKLDIRIQNSSDMPDVASLTHHGATLKSLSVIVLDEFDQQHRYSAKDLMKICRSCRGLEQLSIMFPFQPLDLSKNSLRKEFLRCLYATTHLQYLHTLNITSFPPSRSRETGLVPLRYNGALRREFARRIFGAKTPYDTNEHRQSKLTLLAIGADSVNLPDRRMLFGDRMERFHYLRDKHTDALGRTSVTALLVDSHLVKYVAPESDILDFGFY